MKPCGSDRGRDIDMRVPVFVTKNKLMLFLMCMLESFCWWCESAFLSAMHFENLRQKNEEREIRS